MLIPGESSVTLDSSGLNAASQQPLIAVIWLPLCSSSLSTDINTGGSDAPIAIVRSHNVNPNASLDSARGDSLTSLGVAGTCCSMNRDRTAIRRFGYDRIAIHA
jgi:hypothetical protein